MRLIFNLFLFLLFTCFVAQAQTTNAKVDRVIVDTIYTTYYAKKFEGRKTTSGQKYRGAKFTAAHRTLPFGTMLSVKNLRTGKTVEVRVNDRGPFSKKFSLDLSQVAAKTIGIYKLGYAKVEITYSLPQ